MRKFNLDFIGEIVSSPKGMCSWSGTTVSFWGKFNEEDDFMKSYFAKDSDDYWNFRRIDVDVIQIW